MGPGTKKGRKERWSNVKKLADRKAMRLVKALFHPLSCQGARNSWSVIPDALCYYQLSTMLAGLLVRRQLLANYLNAK